MSSYITEGFFKLQQYQFQIHLGGIIDLLSHHLYSGPHVFIRELMQNGVDAIQARKQIEEEHQGRMDIQVVDARDDLPPTLVFEDNGIGLTEEEVHRFLATIGESSKRNELAVRRGDFIGQFGIGLLSCFMVADEILMITRSAREAGHPAVEWRGKSDGTYEVRLMETDVSPGTRVYLRARKGMEAYFTKDQVGKLVRHFGDLLSTPIYLSHGDWTERINDRRPPWERVYVSSEEERRSYLEYGNDLFGQHFIDYIPLRSEAGGVVGAAYVLSQATSPKVKSHHRVYLKGMLLSDQVENLLPDWAVFVRCVVNAEHLRPVASREGFYENEELEATRTVLGETLRAYLIRLAERAPHRLQDIIQLHHMAICSLAAHDEECFRVFGDFITFETTMGRMTLGDCRKRYDTIRYASSVDEFRQIAQVAASQNLCILNAGYVYNRELLSMLEQVEPDLQVEQVDAANLTHHLEDLTLEEREKAFLLLRTADLTLQPYRTASDIKKFEPTTLPTIYTSNEQANFARQARLTKELADDTWGGILNAFENEYASSQYAQLCFNFKNRLIQRLMKIQDRTVLKRVVEMLYVQALLMGHHPLSDKEMALLNQGLLQMIDAVLGQEGDFE
ncbi:molecular chaperone HtpG [Marinithermofilum abyssi]|uniref:Molecular chaperone HtpG n=1 Tax=Marinithermofilum abyssi TaxID=1571185 RepID=A0A8J2YDC8_9BACL|nr:HSP90 family protein [Marinithermofilum abyssi]GGE08936.1 molecular chaperone HtpG [Marinithermofilum abyssi]